MIISKNNKIFTLAQFLPKYFRRDFVLASFVLFKPMILSKLKKDRQTLNKYDAGYRAFIEKRSIFVHIPKCAGISVNRTLFCCNGGGHASIRQYQLVFTKQEFDEFFKFAFVRNPWDRVFSAYNFLSRGGMTEGDEQWAREYVYSYPSFEDFVCQGGLEKAIKACVFHFEPQLPYLLKFDGSMGVDYIGRFENLEEDFSFVAKKIGASCALRQENRIGDRYTYLQSYTTRMIQIVREYYAKDIEYFDYNFEESN